MFSDHGENDCSEVLALEDGGRVFHTRAAATGKARTARSPRVERRVDGTISVDVAADRRRRRASAVLCSVSARYCGAVPLRICVYLVFVSSIQTAE